MVVHTSDSCNTLVSLEEGNKKVVDAELQQNKAEYQHYYKRTDLLLPEESCAAEYLYLPANNNNNDEQHVDEFFKTHHHAIVKRRADEFLSTPVKILNAHNTKEKVLYVSQGELAHASSDQQCDVLVSDKATTCHVLAIRSSTSSSNTSAALSSLTHLDDGECYEECIRKIFQHHKNHHFDNFEEEKKDSPVIQVQIHVVGGFQDDTSRNISNFLLHLLAQIAFEERGVLQMTLNTCAVSGLNGNDAPIGRGMGIDIRTGHVFLAKVENDCLGPCPDLRSVRLWNHHTNNRRTLTLIHSNHSNLFMIEPFQFEEFEHMDLLMSLPDPIMLEYVSTSPAVEEDDFCDNIRRSLQFLKRHSSEQVFGKGGALLFRRSGRNGWKQVHC